MKISEHIKKSIDACENQELDEAMLHVCLAVDGTASKAYPSLQTGERFKRFIVENIDIIELMFGGINLQETVFPFNKKNGKLGMKFEEIVYEKIRCNYAHGGELPKGYALSLKVASDINKFSINIENQCMILPESVICALGLPCVLAPVNGNQQIGSNTYYYCDPINRYVIDRWWGKIECARKIMDFEKRIRITLNF